MKKYVIKDKRNVNVNGCNYTSFKAFSFEKGGYVFCGRFMMLGHDITNEQCADYVASVEEEDSE